MLSSSMLLLLSIIFFPFLLGEKTSNFIEFHIETSFHKITKENRHVPLTPVNTRSFDLPIVGRHEFDSATFHVIAELGREVGGVESRGLVV